VFERCKIEAPEFQQVKPGHWVACHLRDAPAAGAVPPTG
jgi:hypothetical protein